MHRTNASLGSAATRSRTIRERIDEQSRLNPEWESWLRLFAIAVEACEDSAWAAGAPSSALTSPAGDGVPILNRTTLAVEPQVARRLVRRLVKQAAASDAAGAASLRELKFRHLDAPALLEAALRQDEAALGRACGESGADAAALMAVAQLAAMPLLHACRAGLPPAATASWRRGYCPVCGAWPALAELRGLERTRRLRCGRCGADWGSSVLHCPFCDEKDHEKLGSLIAEGEAQTRNKVEVCKSCKGYVKTLTTLAPIRPAAVPLEDLATVPLDLAAQQRGYARPASPGFSLEVVVVRAGSTLRRLAERWA